MGRMKSVRVMVTLARLVFGPDEVTMVAVGCCRDDFQFNIF